MVLAFAERRSERIFCKSSVRKDLLEVVVRIGKSVKSSLELDEFRGHNVVVHD